MMMLVDEITVVNIGLTDYFGFLIEEEPHRFLLQSTMVSLSR